MECKWLVDLLKQPKKKQQHRAYHGPCGDFIDCTMILYYLCIIQTREWVRVRMNMKQKSGIHGTLTVEDVTECAL